MAELKSITTKATVTPTHHFIKYLDDNERLLRCYTQNIDCLENRLELGCDKKTKRVVQLHGDLDTVVCTLCKTEFNFSEEYRFAFGDGAPPECPSCVRSAELRVADGKRTMATGRLRPNIVLYNEPHAKGEEIASITNYDMKRRPDLLIVMGTSLKVVGIKTLVRALAKSVKSMDRGKVIFINNTEVGKEWDDVFDFHVLERTDDVVRKLKIEMEKLEGLSEARRERRAEAKARKAIKLEQIGACASALNVDETTDGASSDGTFALPRLL